MHTTGAAIRNLSFCQPYAQNSCCRNGFADNITRDGVQAAAVVHRTIKTIVRLVQTTNKSDHIIVCMDDISTCVGCPITPSGSPNLDCIDNNQSSRQTIHHLRVLLLCARAVCGLLVCSCLLHVCAHYTLKCCLFKELTLGPITSVLQLLKGMGPASCSKNGRMFGWNKIGESENEM